MSFTSSRRSFIFGSSALALSGCATKGIAESGKSVASLGTPADLRLKFGVLSDIHITDWASTKIFRKTLTYFKNQNVDAVMIVGDLADHGLLPQLENVAKAWFEVFPNDCGLGGKHVERLFVYGNHDPEGLCYRDADMDGAFSAMHLTYEEAEKVSLFKLGMGACWEKCFHEPYAQIYTKNVKGYDFIGGHWDNIRGNWNGMLDLEDWFKANIGKINTNQPFFYFQHASPKGTVYADDSWGDDSGMATRCLAPYANAVAFSGHSHRPLTDERSYWRGEFTSIGTSTLSYVCLSGHGNRLNIPDYRKGLRCRHGQIVSVYDDRLEIERCDFFHDESLGDNVILPMPTKVGTFTARGVAKAALPLFPAEAKATLTREKKRLALSFPGAFANPTARPFDYRVYCEFMVKDKNGKEQKKHLDRLFYQPAASFSRKRAEAKPIKFFLPGKEVPKDFISAKATVTPRNCYGVEGPNRLTAKI